MKHTMIRTLAMFLFVAGIVFQADAKKKIESFELEDFSGQKHSLTDYSSSQAIVLMFIATQCPVSNAYNDRMVQLYKDYAGKNVTFIGINSNKQESLEDIKTHASEHGFEFPILKDWNNTVADRLEASVTPEIFVLDKDLTIVYHGRIDDSRREAEVTSRDLRTALDAMLSGKEIAQDETKAFGCSIKRIK